MFTEEQIKDALKYNGSIEGTFAYTDPRFNKETAFFNRVDERLKITAGMMWNPYWITLSGSELLYVRTSVGHPGGVYQNDFLLIKRGDSIMTVPLYDARIENDNVASMAMGIALWQQR